MRGFLKRDSLIFHDKSITYILSVRFRSIGPQTPLWGGDSHNGIDCSAFTRRVMQMASHQNLPRTAAEQSHRGYPVSQDQLKPGDLVFFMTEPDVRHVGVFVGNDQFIHASSSHGVMLSHLSGSYWQEHYLGAAWKTEIIPR
ncbi:NlpC/P60 family protein (plasmid) [Enterobacter mori]|uniref:C40 family peptidase n=1 Tax=Enterobacter mori TaxID=539813 RepID=UPI0032AF9231